MRPVLLSLACLCLGVSATGGAFAQRAQLTPPRAGLEAVTPAPQRTVRFRVRSADERIAAIGRIETQRRNGRAASTAALAFNARQLSSSFTVTPRAPFVMGQGALHANHAEFTAWADPVGELWFHGPNPNTTSAPNFALRLQGLDSRRLLIECSIEGNGDVFHGFLVRDGVQLWADDAIPYQNVVSFLTPPMPAQAQPEAIFSVIPENQSPGMYGWVLYGCEVTRLTP
ncbi:MAG: hypothetical protein ABL871_11265 [Terricaulis sp.]